MVIRKIEEQQIAKKLRSSLDRCCKKIMVVDKGIYDVYFSSNGKYKGLAILAKEFEGELCFYHFKDMDEWNRRPRNLGHLRGVGREFNRLLQNPEAVKDISKPKVYSVSSLGVGASMGGGCRKSLAFAY